MKQVQRLKQETNDVRKRKRFNCFLFKGIEKVRRLLRRSRKPLKLSLFFIAPAPS